MSMTINTNMNAGNTQGVYGVEPQIIDVKTGEGTARAGFSVTVSTTGAVDGVDGTLTPSQEADLEALLEVLGLDGENAKTATMQTVLQAIQKAIRQQSVTMTTCTKAISDYDVTRLKALQKALEPLAESGDDNAKLIIGNVNRMLVLKNEIETLANEKGLTFTGKASDVMGNETPGEINGRVREMGDRIGDIRYYMDRMAGGSGHGKSDGGAKMAAALDNLAPAMKSAVRDLLDAYRQTSGWGTGVTLSYSQMSTETLTSITNFIASPDLQLPSQISKDALLQILKEIQESLGPNATAAQIDKALEEKMQEIAAQLADIEIPVQA